MSRGLRLLAACAVAVALAGCAYKPLKAPCAADEGGLTVAYSSLRPAGPDPIPGTPAVDGASAAHVACGPLRPI